MTTRLSLFIWFCNGSIAFDADQVAPRPKQPRRVQHVVEGGFLSDIAVEESSTAKIVLSEAHDHSTGEWTGHRIWPSAVVLLHHLHQMIGQNLQGLQVLELGSGLPFLGACLAAFGAEVCSTDLPEMLPHAQACLDQDTAGAKLSGLTVSARGRLKLRPLAWGHDEYNFAELCGFSANLDLVIGADLVYDNFDVDALYRTLVATLQTGNASAVLALQPRRFPQKMYLGDPQKIGNFVRRLAKQFEDWEVSMNRPSKELIKQVGENVEDVVVVTIRPPTSKIPFEKQTEHSFRYSRAEL